MIFRPIATVELASGKGNAFEVVADARGNFLCACYKNGGVLLRWDEGTAQASTVNFTLEDGAGVSCVSIADLDDDGGCSCVHVGDESGTIWRVDGKGMLRELDPTPAFTRVIDISASASRCCAAYSNHVYIWRKGEFADGKRVEFPSSSFNQVKGVVASNSFFVFGEGDSAGILRYSRSGKLCATYATSISKCVESSSVLVCLTETFDCIHILEPTTLLVLFRHKIASCLGFSCLPSGKLYTLSNIVSRKYDMMIFEYSLHFRRIRQERSGNTNGCILSGRFLLHPEGPNLEVALLGSDTSKGRKTTVTLQQEAKVAMDRIANGNLDVKTKLQEVLRDLIKHDEWHVRELCLETPADAKTTEIFIEEGLKASGSEASAMNDVFREAQHRFATYLLLCTSFKNWKYSDWKKFCVSDIPRTEMVKAAERADVFCMTILWERHFSADMEKMILTYLNAIPLSVAPRILSPWLVEIVLPRLHPARIADVGEWCCGRARALERADARPHRALILTQTFQKYINACSQESCIVGLCERGNFASASYRAESWSRLCSAIPIAVGKCSALASNLQDLEYLRKEHGLYLSLDIYEADKSPRCSAILAILDRADHTSMRRIVDESARICADYFDLDIDSILCEFVEGSSSEAAACAALSCMYREHSASRLRHFTKASLALLRKAVPPYSREVQSCIESPEFQSAIADCLDEDAILSEIVEYTKLIRLSSIVEQHGVRNVLDLAEPSNARTLLHRCCRTAADPTRMESSFRDAMTIVESYHSLHRQDAETLFLQNVALSLVFEDVEVASERAKTAINIIEKCRREEEGGHYLPPLCAVEQASDILRKFAPHVSDPFSREVSCTPQRMPVAPGVTAYRSTPPKKLQLPGSRLLYCPLEEMEAALQSWKASEEALRNGDKKFDASDESGEDSKFMGGDLFPAYFREVQITQNHSSRLLQSLRSRQVDPLLSYANGIEAHHEGNHFEIFQREIERLKGSKYLKQLSTISRVALAVCTTIDVDSAQSKAFAKIAQYSFWDEHLRSCGVNSPQCHRIETLEDLRREAVQVALALLSHRDRESPIYVLAKFCAAFGAPADMAHECLAEAQIMRRPSLEGVRHYLAGFSLQQSRDILRRVLDAQGGHEYERIRTLCCGMLELDSKDKLASRALRLVGALQREVECCKILDFHQVLANPQKVIGEASILATRKARKVLILLYRLTSSEGPSDLDKSISRLLLGAAKVSKEFSFELDILPYISEFSSDDAAVECALASAAFASPENAEAAFLFVDQLTGSQGTALNFRTKIVIEELGKVHAQTLLEHLHDSNELACQILEKFSVQAGCKLFGLEALASTWFSTELPGNIESVFLRICAMNGVDFSRVCKYMVYAQWLTIKPWQYSADNVQGGKAQEAKIIIRVSYVLTAAILQSIKSQNFEMGEKLLRGLIHYSQESSRSWWSRQRAICAALMVKNFLRRGQLADSSDLLSDLLHEADIDLCTDLQNALLQLDFELAGIPPVEGNILAFSKSRAADVLRSLLHHHSDGNDDAFAILVQAALDCGCADTQFWRIVFDRVLEQSNPGHMQRILLSIATSRKIGTKKLPDGDIFQLQRAVFLSPQGSVPAIEDRFVHMLYREYVSNSTDDVLKILLHHFLQGRSQLALRLAQRIRDPDSRNAAVQRIVDAALKRKHVGNILAPLLGGTSPVSDNVLGQVESSQRYDAIFTCDENTVEKFVRQMDEDALVGVLASFRDAEACEYSRRVVDVFIASHPTSAIARCIAHVCYAKAGSAEEWTTMIIDTISKIEEK
eukprot:g3586.t1